MDSHAYTATLRRSCNTGGFGALGELSWKRVDDVDRRVSSGEGSVSVPVDRTVGTQLVVVPSAARSDEPDRAPDGSADTMRQGAKVDRRALVTELMNVHGDAVLGFCIRVLGDRSLAEDMAQQVFLEAYRDLESTEVRSSWLSWLFGIASHRCIDLARQRARTAKHFQHHEEAVEHVDPGVGPAEHFERVQQIAALERCLEVLSPDVRATILLRFGSSASYPELATLLAATADALQVRVARALPVLRRCMESKGWDR